MRAVHSIVLSGLTLALLAGTPGALAQNGRRERRDQQQAAPAPSPKNDRRQRAEPPRPSPAPAPAPAPQLATPSPQPARPIAPPPGLQNDAPRQRSVAPTPNPPQGGNMDRRQRSNSQPAPPPSPAPRVDRPPTLPAPQAIPQTPPPTPQINRTRSTPRTSPAQPLANNDRRRERDTPRVAPPSPTPDFSNPLSPAPQAQPQAEASRRGPRVEWQPRAPRPATGDRIALPPDARRDGDAPRGDPRDLRADFRDHNRRDFRDDRDPSRYGSFDRHPDRHVIYPSRRPVEILRPHRRVDLSIVIGSGLAWRPRYEPVCEPVRVVCPPVTYCPPRRHWYRPVYTSCAWDRWCEPRWTYSPYTLFPAPLWPGPTYTFSTWPYYSTGSSLGISFFTSHSSSRAAGSFFYSSQAPLFTSSTTFYDTSSPWYSSGSSTPGSSTAVETFRADASPSLTQALPTPADTGSGAIRVLTDAAPPTPPTGFSAVLKPASVTIYRASHFGGTLAWSDSPSSILSTVASASRDDRADAAANFLGRSPAGAWEVTYEKWRRTAIGPELICRAALPNEAGWRATVVIRLKDAAIDPVERLRAGQRLSVSGFLGELTIDDPNHPGGLLILEDGKMSP